MERPKAFTKLRNQLEWENIPECNFCGGTENKTYLYDESIFFNGKFLHLVECQKCHLVYAKSRPTFETLKKMYENKDIGKYRLEKKIRRFKVNEIHSSYVKEALSFKPSAESLFDMGTGAGTILLEARKLGLNVAGNDINTVCCKWLKKQGIEIYNIPTNELQLNRKFDIIMCLDYLEHTYTPFDDLKWIANHISEGGILYLKTLWLNCPNHRRMGNKWNLFGGQHYYYYYPFVLKNMMREVGFKIFIDNREPAIIHLIGRYD